MSLTSFVLIIGTSLLITIVIVEGVMAFQTMEHRNEQFRNIVTNMPSSPVIRESDPTVYFPDDYRKIVPLGSHDEIVALPNWTFINDTSVSPKGICRDYLESAIGIYCMDEKPRVLTRDTILLVDERTITHWYSSNDYKFPEAFQDTYQFMMNCDYLNAEPQITILESEVRVIDYECVLQEPTELEQINNKLDTLIELHE